jgi:Bacterial extracellular solute-binding proteins, family 3.
MIMALQYNKIDAMAVDIDTMKLIMSISEGVEVVEPALGELGSIMYFGRDKEDLKDDFNQYLAEFKKTDEYADFLKRLDEFEGDEYIGMDIPLTGDGDILRVSASPEEFPRAFRYPGEDIFAAMTSKY